MTPRQQTAKRAKLLETIEVRRLKEEDPNIGAGIERALIANELRQIETETNRTTEPAPKTCTHKEFYTYKLLGFWDFDVCKACKAARPHKWMWFNRGNVC